jgi:hypothetical protein
LRWVRWVPDGCHVHHSNIVMGATFTIAMGATFTIATLLPCMGGTVHDNGAF